MATSAQLASSFVNVLVRQDVISSDLASSCLDVLSVDSNNGTHLATTYAELLVVAGSNTIFGSVNCGESTNDSITIDGNVFSAPGPSAGSLSATENLDNAVFAGKVKIQGSLSIQEAFDRTLISARYFSNGDMLVAESGVDTCVIVGAIPVLCDLLLPESGRDTATIKVSQESISPPIIEHLLNSIYNAFDKSPHYVSSLILDHPDGLIASRNGRMLALETALGAPIVDCVLHYETINSLADKAVQRGCELVYMNPDKQYLSASTLVDVFGEIGNTFKAYDTLLWSLIDAYAIELEKAGYQVQEAVKEIIYTTAHGEFVDLWGEYWGFKRLINESDSAYVDRTIRTITRPKSNPIAISHNIKLSTGNDVVIREPWMEIMSLSDRGNLSSDYHLQGMEWQYHYAQVVGRGFDVTEANVIASDMRPAGTILLEPIDQYPGSLLDYELAFPAEFLLSCNSIHTYNFDTGSVAVLSDNLYLSDYGYDEVASFTITEELL